MSYKTTSRKCIILSFSFSPAFQATGNWHSKEVNDRKLTAPSGKFDCGHTEVASQVCQDIPEETPNEWIAWGSVAKPTPFTNVFSLNVRAHRPHYNKTWTKFWREIPVRYIEWPARNKSSRICGQLFCHTSIIKVPMWKSTININIHQLVETTKYTHTYIYIHHIRC